MVLSNACPFMWCVCKAPRVPRRSCLLESQLGTRQADQVIGECCRDLPSSSEGVTGKPAHRAHTSVDHSDRLPLYSSSNKKGRFCGRASRVAVRHGRMTFSNLSTIIHARLACKSYHVDHLYVILRTWGLGLGQERMRKCKQTTVTRRRARQCDHRVGIAPRCQWIQHR